MSKRARRIAIMACSLIAPLLLPSACGRIGFDALPSDAGDDSGVLTDDAAAPDADQTPSFALQAYLKASNTELDDEFGRVVSISDDGNTLAVSAYSESSGSTGVGSAQNNNDEIASGAVYVFRRSGDQWSQLTYIKASNTDAGDRFGASLALSADGKTLAVGAPLEDSGNPLDTSDNLETDSGAVYVFRDTNPDWVLESYIKATNHEARDLFGSSVSLSGDGNVLAVSAPLEDSTATGFDGDASNNGRDASGAAYVFKRDVANTWTQKAYLKASVSGFGARFGSALALSNSGKILAVAADDERSAATGVDGDDTDTTASSSGAVFVFEDVDVDWPQRAYLKASNTDADDRFGIGLAISGDGNTIAVGASFEDSDAFEVDGDGGNNNSSAAGAAYVFRLVGASWQQKAYLKTFNGDKEDQFGTALALNDNGSVLAVSAVLEDSASVTVNGSASSNAAMNSGAVYVFGNLEGPWKRTAYVKATNTGEGDLFGFSIALSRDGLRLLVGASQEASSSRGIDGNASDNSAKGAGAVYSFEL